MSNVNVFKFKKNNREGLFTKLKNQGYAFTRLSYKQERTIKINKFLNEGLLGWTSSVKLKDDIIIDLLIFANKIELKIKSVIIKEIINWENDINKTFSIISNEYDKYLYSKEEILEHYKNNSDIKDITSILNSFYPELKVRRINKDKTHFSVMVGSGIVSYLIEKPKIENKKTVLHSYFLCKNKNVYSNFFWAIPFKYKKILKPYYKYNIYSLNLKRLKLINEKIKNLN